MKDDIYLLETGTTDAVVAKNWHQHGVVKAVESEIESLNKMLADIDGATSDSELVKDVVIERDKFIALVNNFIKQWPSPTVTEIQDRISLVTNIPVGWRKVELQSTRPLESLICRVNPTSKEHLFYEHPTSGKIFKVLNIAENKPNKVLLLTFSY